MRVEAYSAIYGGYDIWGPQAIPVRLFTDETHPLPHYTDPRKAAKWWKVFPHLACPDADVTIWLDGRMEVRCADLADRALDALGDADLLLVRHPFWDDIYRDAVESRKALKYRGEPMEEQVAAYRAAGHPAHFGLMHCGFLVRRDNDRMRAFNAAWWAEIERWSIQDQLSLPEMLRTHPEIAVRWWPRSPLDVNRGDAGWVRWRPRPWDKWGE